MEEDINIIKKHYVFTTNHVLDDENKRFKQAIENLINKCKEQEKQLDKAEEKCGELFAVLFTVIRNNTILPKGEELGKSQIEITQMTVQTIDKLIEMIDYVKVKELLEEAGQMQ